MEIVTRAGRRISLELLEQRKLYAGVLCGRFSKAANERRVREWAEEAGLRAKWFDGIVLIPSAGRIVPARPADGMPEGERLPPVIAFSIWRGDSPAGNPDATGSLAAVAWCQDEFGAPDARAVDSIRALDWDAVSIDASD